MIELNQLESSYYKPRPRFSPSTFGTKQGNTSKPNDRKRKTYSICKKLGFPDRTHPEQFCNNAKIKAKRENKSTIRIANNIEWEEKLKDEITRKKNLLPLIVLEINIEDIKANGLYDPGANISLIHKSFLRNLNDGYTV